MPTNVVDEILENTFKDFKMVFKERFMGVIMKSNSHLLE